MLYLPSRSKGRVFLETKPGNTMSNLHQDYLACLQQDYRGINAEGKRVNLTLQMCEALDTYQVDCETVQHQLGHGQVETAKAIMNLAKFKFDLALKCHGLVRLVKA